MAKKMGEKLGISEILQ